MSVLKPGLDIYLTRKKLIEIKIPFSRVSWECLGLVFRKLETFLVFILMDVIP